MENICYTPLRMWWASDDDEEDLTAADGYNDLSLDGPFVTMSRTMYNNNNKNQFEQYLNVHGFVEVVVVLWQSPIILYMVVLEAAEC